MIIFLLFFLFTTPLICTQNYFRFDTVTLPDSYGSPLDLHQTIDGNIVTAYYNEETNEFRLVKTDPTGRVIKTSSITIASEYNRVYIEFTDDFAILIGSGYQLCSFLMRFSYTELALDETFGTNGVVTVYHPSDDSHINTIKKHDSYYYLAGANGSHDLTFFRYHLDGSPDNTFNDNSHFKEYEYDILNTLSPQSCILLILSEAIIYMTTKKIFSISRTDLSIRAELEFETASYNNFPNYLAQFLPKDGTTFFALVPRIVINDVGRAYDYTLAIEVYDQNLQPITSFGSFIIVGSGVSVGTLKLSYIEDYIYSLMIKNTGSNIHLFLGKHYFDQISLANLTTQVLFSTISLSLPSTVFLVTNDPVKPFFFLAQGPTIKRVNTAKDTINESLRINPYTPFLS